jgi:integrase
LQYRFYLDKRFKKGVDITEVRRLEKQGKDIGKYLNKKETSVYLGITHDGRYLKASTGIRLLPKHFDVRNQRVKSSHIDCVELNIRLDHLRQAIVASHYTLIMKGKEPSAAKIKALMIEHTKGASTKLTTTDFFKILDQFIEEKKKVFKPQTIKNYGSYKSAMKKYVRAGHTLNIDDIGEAKWRSIYTFFQEELGYLNNSIAKQGRCTKAFCNWMYDKGYIDNQEYKKIPDKEDDIDIIYLTWDEINSLGDLDLSGHEKLTQTRDMFLFQIHTGQRISDLLTLGTTDIITEEGVTYWRNYQTKGSRTTPTYIPLSETALSILKKYTSGLDVEMRVFAKTNSTKYNAEIKQVCKLAGIDADISITRYSGNRKIEITKKKYELITSHIARKTFISIGLRRGIPKDIIMKITGHRDERSVRAYLNLDRDFVSREAFKVWS